MFNTETNTNRLGSTKKYFLRKGNNFKVFHKFVVVDVNVIV